MTAELRRPASAPLWARLIWTGHLALGILTEPRFPFRSSGAIERAQRRRVRAMVRHAYRHVPHYREVMDGLGLRPEELRGAADLARLPLIDREQLQRDPLRFVSRARPLERYQELHTGGSTGAPITVFRDPLGLRADAHVERGRVVQRRLAGKRRRLRALIISSPLSPGAVARRAASGRVLAPRWARVRSREISLLEPPDRVLAAIEEFRPDVVASYGSYLEALFVHVRHAGTPVHMPRVVVYSADALPEPARRLISETFGIDVLSYYSAVEAPMIGFECEEHLGMHLNCDLYPLRVVGEGGEEVPDGETGEVVVSNLVNRGTVLLNYRLGDMARKLPGACPCGRTLPLLSLPEGRVGDWIRTPGGERMHPQGIRTLFTDESEVWRYQVVQRSPSRFAVALVVSPECDRARLETRLAEKFSGRLGKGTAIEVSFVDSLPRTSRGKVRTVVGLAEGAGVPGAAGEGAGATR